MKDFIIQIYQERKEVCSSVPERREFTSERSRQYDAHDLYG
jgi:hypothetical protein